jgi:beta-galactosidase
LDGAQVWLDGTRIGSHAGGFTPFGWDVTELLTPGRAAVLAVRLDNTDQPTVPPGKPQSGLDWDYFGGLYRNVWLTAVDPVHVADPIIEGRVAGGGVFVTVPHADRDHATVHVRTDVVNRLGTDATVTVRATLVDAADRVVATTERAGSVGSGATQAFEADHAVPAPRLWSPDSPYLYGLHVEVRRGGRVLDHTSTRVGVRRLAWSYTDGFSINGTRLLLTGTNRGHQEYPYVGYAAPASQQRRDALLIRRSGANFVRSAHYPPDPAFLDACDEVGLMVLDSIPGWQYWSDDPDFAARSHDDLRTMIRRDRNHPSVIAWDATLNETYSGNTPYEQQQHAIAHEEYPGDQLFAYGGNGAYDEGRADARIFEVQNAYWSHPEPGDPPQSSPPAALLWREYGDWEFGGNDHNTSRTTRADGEQAMLRTVRNKQSELSAFTAPGYFGSGTLAGLATWSAFDYNRGADATPCYSGLLDLFRVPKFAFWFYQSQRDPRVRQDGVSDGPMLYIANWWQPPADSGPVTVVVFSNCDEVELFRNGTSVARQRPDHGEIDARVPHPPFTFALGYEPGELRAVGYLAGRRVRSATVRTPLAAARLHLDVDLPDGRLVADGVDFAVVRASVLDAHGTVVPDNAHRVEFTARGAGAIVGDARIGANPVTATAGVATALLRAGRTAGRVALTATSPGLDPAHRALHTTQDRTPRL